MKTLKLLRRWTNMILGKSSFHVKQDIGQFYSKKEIKGYYNDMRNKVSDDVSCDKEGIPINTTIANIQAYFPITIFQYGLGLYDIYLETNDMRTFNKFITIANWAMANIDENGMWDCMKKINDQAHLTQSSMCQSEGVSVLVRAYIETKNGEYLKVASKAIDFMVKDVKEGGTTIYDGDDVIFQEYVSKYNLSVLNGWIFSIFGLFDYTLICNDSKYENILKKTIDTLSKMLNKFDRKFWSNYDIKGTIASPAYHDLHTKQLKVLYDLFNIEEFRKYEVKWEKYQNNKAFKLLSMIIKFKQKIIRNNFYDINTSLVK